MYLDLYQHGTCKIMLGYHGYADHILTRNKQVKVLDSQFVVTTLLCSSVNKLVLLQECTGIVDDEKSYGDYLMDGIVLCE